MYQRITIHHCNIHKHLAVRTRKRRKVKRDRENLVSNYMCHWKPLITQPCKQGKVTNEIQDLMATRFIRETKWWIQPAFAGTKDKTMGYMTDGVKS